MPKRDETARERWRRRVSSSGWRRRPRIRETTSTVPPAERPSDESEFEALARGLEQIRQRRAAAQAASDPVFESVSEPSGLPEDFGGISQFIPDELRREPNGSAAAGLGPLGGLAGGLHGLLQGQERSGDVAAGALGGMLGEAVARRLGQQLPTAPEFDPAAYGYVPIAGPARDGYLRPFDDAEAAARRAHKASSAVIDDTYTGLGETLDQNQAEYAEDLAEQQKLRAAERALVARQQAESFGTGSLAQELGVDGDLAAQASLLADLQRQSDQGAKTVADELATSQAQDFQSRKESVEGGRGAAQATAATNLESLLGQIGLGRAEAERQFAADAASVQNRNAQGLAQARAAYQRDLEAREKEFERYVTDQEKLAENFTIPVWDQRSPKTQERMRRNPKAMEFFDFYIGEVGDSRTPRNMREAIRGLDAAAQGWKEATGQSIDTKVLAQWLREYYGEESIFDEEAFIRSGGDLSVLGGRR